MLCDNSAGWDGVGGRKEVQEGADMCIPMAASCCSMAETNTTRQNNCPPIKNIVQKRKDSNGNDLRTGPGIG